MPHCPSQQLQTGKHGEQSWAQEEGEERLCFTNNPLYCAMKSDTVQEKHDNTH